MNCLREKPPVPAGSPDRQLRCREDNPPASAVKSRKCLAGRQSDDRSGNALARGAGVAATAQRPATQESRVIWGQKKGHAYSGAKEGEGVIKHLAKRWQTAGTLTDSS